MAIRVYTQRKIRNTNAYSKPDKLENPYLITNHNFLTYDELRLYGLGWQVSKLLETPWIHHGGSLPGFRSEYARFPQAGLSIIVLTNSNDAKPEAIAKEIATLYLRSSSGKATNGK